MKWLAAVGAVVLVMAGSAQAGSRSLVARGQAAMERIEQRRLEDGQITRYRVHGCHNRPRRVTVRCTVDDWHIESGVELRDHFYDWRAVLQDDGRILIHAFGLYLPR